MIDITLPKKAQGLFKPKRYKVLFGGRDSAKSTSVGLYLLLSGIRKTERILCTRQIQVSIANSVHKLLSDLNTQYNLGYITTDRSIKHPVTGTEFIFAGLYRNVTSIKSLEGITKCFCEEAEAITKDSWKLLIPTIREEESEIIIVFNPMEEDDDTYQRFVSPYLSELSEEGIYEDPNILLIKMNYWDNPYLSITSKNEIERLKAEDEEEYNHVYLGEPVGQEERTLIKSSWIKSAIDAHKIIPFNNGGINVLGFDPADEGNDTSGVVGRQGNIVNHIEQYKDNLEKSTEIVLETCKGLGIDVVNYDICGIGIGVKVKAKQIDPLNKYKWTPVNNSHKASGMVKGDKNTDVEIPAYKVFKNKRAQLYWNLRERFRKTHLAVTEGIFINPEEMISISSECNNLKELQSELKSILRVYGSLIQIESKTKMKKSPNLVDSLAYAFEEVDIAEIIEEDFHISFESEW